MHENSARLSGVQKLKRKLNGTESFGAIDQDRIPGLQSFRKYASRIPVEQFDITASAQFCFRSQRIWSSGFQLDTRNSRFWKTARQNQGALSTRATRFQNLPGGKGLHRREEQKHFALPNSAETGFGFDIRNNFPKL